MCITNPRSAMQIDFLDAQIASFDAQIVQCVADQAPPAPPTEPPTPQIMERLGYKVSLEPPATVAA